MAKLSMPLLLPASRAAAAACRQNARLFCCHSLGDASSSAMLQFCLALPQWLFGEGKGIAIHGRPEGKHGTASCLFINACSAAGPPRCACMCSPAYSKVPGQLPMHCTSMQPYTCCKECTGNVHLLAKCWCRCLTGGRRLLWRSEGAPSTSKSLTSQADAISMSEGDAYILWPVHEYTLFSCSAGCVWLSI